MADIDWAALLDGQTPPPRDLISEQLSGLHTDLDVSLTTTSNTRRNITVSTEESVEDDESVASAGSFLNLHDINDLLPESPDLPASKSATSLKSNVTFSESEPEVYNIAEELNLLSIGELSVAEEVTSEAADYSRDAFTSVYNTETGKSKQTESAITESGGVITDGESGSDEIAEDIKTRSDPWKVAKNRLLNKGTEIPVFMVGPKKKQLHRDLSFSRSNEETASPVKSSRSRVSVASSSGAKARKSGTSYTSVISDGPSYNYTTVSSEDVTTISESSELQTVTKSHCSVTQVKLETPCCKCRCQNVQADLNMKPLPLFSGLTLDKNTLEQMSQLNPDKIALLNMMKAQYNLTKGLIEITSGILDSEIGKCRPKFRHTSLEETKRYIKKHQPYKSSKMRTGKKKNSS